jgi:hypothetical protein
MNKLIITLMALLVMVSGVFAQASVDTSVARKSTKPFSQFAIRPYGWQDRNSVRAQSLDVSTTGANISVLWLRDSLTNDYTAFSYPVFEVQGLGNRVNIVALGAYQMNTVKTNVYAGTGLSLDLVNTDGWKLSGYAGLKGLNLTQNFTAAQGKGMYVFGLSLTVPIK